MILGRFFEASFARPRRDAVATSTATDYLDKDGLPPRLF